MQSVSTLKASTRCFEIIKRFEALRLDVYRCPAGKLTIGWGHVLKSDETYTKITEEKAQELLEQDVVIAETCVKCAVKVILNQNQFDALVDFVFNLGCGQFMNSTLLKLINNSFYTSAAKQFTRWVYTDGEMLDGLIARRELEQALFLEPVTV